ncbi:hypothetical protein KEM54_000885 [Ascosphaera aggregata]|nr:hypothetical protein KEM54_000885 [Ascosphaera aggregata]
MDSDTLATSPLINSEPSSAATATATATVTVTATAGLTSPHANKDSNISIASGSGSGSGIGNGNGSGAPSNSAADEVSKFTNRDSFVSPPSILGVREERQVRRDDGYGNDSGDDKYGCVTSSRTLPSLIDAAVVVPVCSNNSRDVKRDSVMSPTTYTALRDSKATFSSTDNASIDTRRNVPSIVISNETISKSSLFSASTGDIGKPTPARKRMSLARYPLKVDSKAGSSVSTMPRDSDASERRLHAFAAAAAGSAGSAGSAVTSDVAGPDESCDSKDEPSQTQPSESYPVIPRSQSSASRFEDLAEVPPIPPPKSALRYASSSQPLQTSSSSMETPRPLSLDEEVLSQKLRLMYERGDSDVSDSEVNLMLTRSSDAATRSIGGRHITQSSLLDDRPRSSAGSVRSKSTERSRGSTVRKEHGELAGGIEDWSGINVEDVDRYGFIKPSGNHPPGHTIQRVSTSLMLASSSPRKQRGQRTSFISSSSNRTPANPQNSRSRASSIQSIQSNRPFSSQSGYKFASGDPRRKYGRRARKYISEAGDMLTIPHNEATDDNSGYALAMKRREWRREDKWQRMAQITNSEHGQGVRCHFDMRNNKLIERTWKGIPDRWRAIAWHSFLDQSSRKRPNYQSDEELIQLFHELQNECSPDDVQIDLDVPRTISSHIMFRRRYRGGQRLLFRVLHAMSLFFPQTGYVQGMAALAATLLAYYDEENAFVMLVRLWQVRGLERLYRSGFSGLMEALNDFEQNWLNGGEIAEKLVSYLFHFGVFIYEKFLNNLLTMTLQNVLGIPPTAYGTRWYLTLFNYAVPFPAQLRVWDVFMLLGDSGDVPTTSGPPGSAEGCTPFGKSLDVLHAVSASLIDGMRDIILNSDFENAMKVLTSWVPIKDVELFMRVARIEWKVHARKKA